MTFPLRWTLIALVVGLLAPSAQARVDKLTVPCDDALCLWERPALPPVPAWQLDTERSQQLRTAIYVLSTRHDADAAATRVVAQAFARTPESGLQAFIDAERERLVGPSLDVQAVDAPSLRDATGTRLMAIEIAPRPGRPGGVQTVVFAQDGAYFVSFSYSAPARAAHRAHYADFKALIAAYRPQPPAAPAKPAPAAAVKTPPQPASR